MNNKNLQLKSENQLQREFRLYDKISEPNPLIKSSIFTHNIKTVFQWKYQEVQTQDYFNMKSKEKLSNLIQKKQNQLSHESFKFDNFIKNQYGILINLFFFNILPRDIQYDNSPKQNTYLLRSNFQSGNLHSYVQKSNYFYIYLNPDTNTIGNTQWFYFSFQGEKNKLYYFTLVNLLKKESLINEGMKIYCKINSKWQRLLTGIYTKSKQKWNERQIYNLDFEFLCPTDQKIYISYHIPYTYSRLQKFLDNLSNDKQKCKYFHRRILCFSKCQNKIDLLTITDPNQENQQKKIVFITARVHPGQTVSSFICQGLIKFLLDDSYEAKLIRKYFVFKIAPMINPDGVIHGNYRTSVCGNDLNRKWKNPDKQSFPEIFYLKKYILEIHQIKKISLYIDLHGHSKKKGIFMYGCKTKFDSSTVFQFPYFLSKIQQNFYLKNCSFNVNKDKQGTARIQLWRQLKIPYVYTLQASFCGAVNQEHHFSIHQYMNIGKSIAIASLFYFSENQLLKLKNNIINLHSNIKSRYLNEKSQRMKQISKIQTIKQQMNNQLKQVEFDQDSQGSSSYSSQSNKEEKQDDKWRQFYRKFYDIQNDSKQKISRKSVIQKPISQVQSQFVFTSQTKIRKINIRPFQNKKTFKRFNIVQSQPNSSAIFFSIDKKRLEKLSIVEPGVNQLINLNNGVSHHIKSIYTRRQMKKK